MIRKKKFTIRKRKRIQSRCREKKKRFNFVVVEKKENIINFQLFHSLQRNCESCESCNNYNHKLYNEFTQKNKFM